MSKRGSRRAARAQHRTPPGVRLLNEELDLAIQRGNIFRAGEDRYARMAREAGVSRRADDGRNQVLKELVAWYGGVGEEPPKLTDDDLVVKGRTPWELCPNRRSAVQYAKADRARQPRDKGHQVHKPWAT